MKQTERLFIAAELPENMVRTLKHTAHSLGLRGKARLSRPENYHVTLAFLGETELARAEQIERAVSRAVENVPPVSAALSGLGYFGKKNDAVLWCGLAGAQPLIALAERIRKNLGQAGIWFDGKPVRPHITLARRADLTGISLEGASPAPAAGTLSNITLFESVREAGRLVYRPLRRFYLKDV